MPKRVKFQGKVHLFPDQATDAQIQAALMESLSGVEAAPDSLEANPPGIPTPPLPYGLSPASDVTSVGGSGNEPGIPKIVMEGLHQLKGALPSFSNSWKAGTADVLEGMGKTLSPLLIPAVVAAPGATALGFGGATIGAGTGDVLSILAGGSPETQRLATDVGGLIGGGLASRLDPGLIGDMIVGGTKGAISNTPVVGPVLKGTVKGAKEAYLARPKTFPKVEPGPLRQSMAETRAGITPGRPPLADLDPVVVPAATPSGRVPGRPTVEMLATPIKVEASTTAAAPAISAGTVTPAASVLPGGSASLPVASTIPEIPRSLRTYYLKKLPVTTEGKSLAWGKDHTIAQHLKELGHTRQSWLKLTDAEKDAIVTSLRSPEAKGSKFSSLFKDARHFGRTPHEIIVDIGNVLEQLNKLKR